MSISLTTSVHKMLSYVAVREVKNRTVYDSKLLVAKLVNVQLQTVKFPMICYVS